MMVIVGWFCCLMSNQCAVFSDNYSDLMEFLKELAAPERSTTILNWNTCGKVYYDFITLSGHMVTLQEVQVS